MTHVDRVPIVIRAGDAAIHADLSMPPHPHGVVVFVHGSGSSRFSTRNRAVAEALQRAGFGTLLLDLLTEGEERRDAITGKYRFDIELLAHRVGAATEWIAGHPETTVLPVGYFGASTGAAAALVAASRYPGHVQAVVSRGGRPDLAGNALRQVRAPTLLIVGGADPEVLRLNQQAHHALGGLCTLRIVPGATHLFGEPGALDAVTDAAIRWYQEHLHAAPITQPLGSE